MNGVPRRQVFVVDSVGRLLRVEASSRLADWWTMLAPHIPGVAVTAPAALPVGSPADVALDDAVGLADARRLINAHLHGVHLRHGTLSLHAVALHHPMRTASVLLLGGHGAGKTLVGLALASRGWRPLAGDVTLLDVGDSGRLSVRGGTRAVLARRGAVHRWFPELAAETSVGGDRTDLSDARDAGSTDVAIAVPVVATVLVAVDGDPRAGTSSLQHVDRHTAATAWLRSSSHLLDRILDSSDAVLRLVEDDATARRRIALVRALANRMPLRTAWGQPEHIATLIEGIPVNDIVRGEAVPAW